MCTPKSDKFGAAWFVLIPVAKFSSHRGSVLSRRLSERCGRG
ncbi:hypothetical protein OYT1_ch1487 [Ferriphaselus amnicola]|uniref:Uncharacterized protein n=1 Tax=Ferriphaselus amnicola TaxID=1188319 RepID=A0A2Z6GBP8_9PROT|nr:hypothetical protein OYT1_ch1487 [Ferriphaselus amnicola]